MIGRTFMILPVVLASLPAWAQAPALSNLEVGAHRELSARVEPGMLYTVNFVSGAHGSDVVAKFSTRGGRVVPMAITHPKSDLTDLDGELKLECPGLQKHSLKVSAATEPMRRGAVHSNSTERGHFGFAFRNTTAAAIDLRVTLTPSRSNIAITFVGLLPGESIKPPEPEPSVSKPEPAAPAEDASRPPSHPAQAPGR
jgi:hypothetical protein